jgi:hypothetical protein
MDGVLALVYLLSLRRPEADDDPARLPGSKPIAALGLTAPPRPPDAAAPFDLLSLGFNDRDDPAGSSSR